MIFQGWQAVDAQFKQLLKQIDKQPRWAAFIALCVGITLSFLPQLLYAVIVVGVLIMLLTTETDE